jgi:hypothetical protein
MADVSLWLVIAGAVLSIVGFFSWKYAPDAGLNPLVHIGNIRWATRSDANWRKVNVAFGWLLIAWDLIYLPVGLLILTFFPDSPDFKFVYVEAFCVLTLCTAMCSLARWAHRQDVYDRGGARPLVGRLQVIGATCFVILLAAANALSLLTEIAEQHGDRWDEHTYLRMVAGMLSSTAGVAGALVLRRVARTVNTSDRPATFKFASFVGSLTVLQSLSWIYLNVGYGPLRLEGGSLDPSLYLLGIMILGLAVAIAGS